ncbi:uncharacterized protein LOC131255794 [Magnolia sinica]|uniref:uncharacterized protein LOC131255794 n=1 Tax=Magnolia sinica TaxID=86752 RepID=UPI0026585DF6|nr:uncharacterized protein LOC131255794 [Magnolia sinica]
MRLRKGSKVEVLSKKEVPSGSWWCGEVVYGNGHYYDVRYYRPLGDQGEPVVEKVPRKDIRPRPPALGCEENWVAGDIAEVFDNHLWKIAEVVNVAGGNCFFVRLLGSSREFRVNKSHLRVRQSWKDGQWVIIGKDSRSGEDRDANELSLAQYYQKPSCRVPLPDVRMKVRAGGNHFQELPTRGVKRNSQSCLSHAETHVGVGRKIRAVEKEGQCQRLLPALPAPFLEKVDAVASPKTMLGDNYMHASFNNRMTRVSEMDMARGIPNADDRCFIPGSLDYSDAESRSSPVASCSSTNCRPYVSHHHFTTHPCQDSDCHSDDAESSSGQEYGRKHPFSRKEVLASEVHQLELHAYRSTMEALFASGPLSWEQEAMMTNLRLMLHISNDEHLLELRHLVSVET